MKLPAFDYAAPGTLAEAVRLLAAHPGAKALAGGQSLIPTLAFRLAAPPLLVDLGRLEELRHISIDAGAVRLGARVRWRDIEDDERLASAHPLLAAAVKHIAHYQIRNRGTVGGSLAHADPAAELPGVAVACDATIAVTGPKGSRSIAAGAFFTGALSTALADDELITELRLPAWPRERRWAFEEFALRRGDFALCMAAAVAGPDGLRVVLGSVVDKPTAIEVDRASPGASAAEQIQAWGSLHASADYQRQLVRVLVDRVVGRVS
jgi:carbon-monoxide dehydrogenase medium subunit